MRKAKRVNFKVEDDSVKNLGEIITMPSTVQATLEDTHVVEMRGTTRELSLHKVMVLICADANAMEEEILTILRSPGFAQKVADTNGELITKPYGKYDRGELPSRYNNLAEKGHGFGYDSAAVELLRGRHYNAFAYLVEKGFLIASDINDVILEQLSMVEQKPNKDEAVFKKDIKAHLKLVVASIFYQRKMESHEIEAMVKFLGANKDGAASAMLASFDIIQKGSILDTLRYLNNEERRSLYAAKIWDEVLAESAHSESYVLSFKCKHELFTILRRYCIEGHDLIMLLGDRLYNQKELSSALRTSGVDPALLAPCLVELKADVGLYNLLKTGTLTSFNDSFIYALVVRRRGLEYGLISYKAECAIIKQYLEICPIFTIFCVLNATPDIHSLWQLLQKHTRVHKDLSFYELKAMPQDAQTMLFLEALWYEYVPQLKQRRDFNDYVQQYLLLTLLHRYHNPGELHNRLRDELKRGYKPTQLRHQVGGRRTLSTKEKAMLYANYLHGELWDNITVKEVMRKGDYEVLKVLLNCGFNGVGLLREAIKTHDFKIVEVVAHSGYEIVRKEHWEYALKRVCDIDMVRTLKTYTDNIYLSSDLVPTVLMHATSWDVVTLLKDTKIFSDIDIAFEGYSDKNRLAQKVLYETASDKVKKQAMNLEKQFLEFYLLYIKCKPHLPLKLFASRLEALILQLDNMLQDNDHYKSEAAEYYKFIHDTVCSGMDFNKDIKNKIRAGNHLLLVAMVAGCKSMPEPKTTITKLFEIVVIKNDTDMAATLTRFFDVPKISVAKAVCMGRTDIVKLFVTKFILPREDLKSLIQEANYRNYRDVALVLSSAYTLPQEDNDNMRVSGYTAVHYCGAGRSREDRRS